MGQNKSWFRRHWILTGLAGFILLMIFFALLGDDPSSVNSPSSNEDRIITINSKHFLLQENEIDRIWTLGDHEELSLNDSGFIEGTKFVITKVESFSVTRVTMEVYRFGSTSNAQQYYNQETSRINIRGVEELNLKKNCFGIDRDSGLSGYAEAYCIRNNLVVYVKSSSSSFFYTGDLKDVLKNILNKIY